MTTCVECGENVVVEKAGIFHVRDPHDPAATADHEVVVKPRVRLIPVLNKREREFGARHPETALGRWTREQDGAA